MYHKRHNLVRAAVAKELRIERYSPYEEKERIAENDSTRRIDIIAVNEDATTGITSDPTIRFETTIGQDDEFNIEKRNKI